MVAEQHLNTVHYKLNTCEGEVCCCIILCCQTFNKNFIPWFNHPQCGSNVGIFKNSTTANRYKISFKCCTSNNGIRRCTSSRVGNCRKVWTAPFQRKGHEYPTGKCHQLFRTHELSSIVYIGRQLHIGCR